MLRRATAGLWAAMALVAVLPAGGQLGKAAGDRIPPFQGIRLDGTEFDSAELAGGFVLLDFWGVWCPPCIGAFPKLSRLHDEFAERGFQVIGLAVLSGTPDEVSEFIESYEVTYPIVVVEPEVPDSFDVLAFPSYFLVGPQGEIVRRYQGQPNDLHELVSGDLESLVPAAPSP